MNSEHTPGPWESQGWSIKIGDRVIAEATARRNAHGGSPLYKTYAAQDKINARLIAAAPDLLEACRQTLERHGVHCSCGYEACEDNRLMAVVRAAVTQATEEV